MKCLALSFKHFTPPHKTFAKNSVISAKKLQPLQVVYALYIRVNVFAKQLTINKRNSIKHLVHLPILWQTAQNLNIPS